MIKNVFLNTLLLTVILTTVNGKVFAQTKKTENKVWGALRVSFDIVEAESINLSDSVLTKPNVVDAILEGKAPFATIVYYTRVEIDKNNNLVFNEDAEFDSKDSKIKPSLVLLENIKRTKNTRIRENLMYFGFSVTRKGRNSPSYFYPGRQGWSFSVMLNGINNKNVKFNKAPTSIHKMEEFGLNNSQALYVTIKNIKCDLKEGHIAPFDYDKKNEIMVTIPTDSK